MGEVIHVVQLKFKPEVDSGKIEEVRPPSRTPVIYPVIDVSRS